MLFIINLIVELADKAFLEKQKDILRLFKYVNQESYYKDHVDIAKQWDIPKQISQFSVSLLPFKLNSANINKCFFFQTETRSC